MHQDKIITMSEDDTDKSVSGDEAIDKGYYSNSSNDRLPSSMVSRCIDASSDETLMMKTIIMKIKLVMRRTRKSHQRMSFMRLTAPTCYLKSKLKMRYLMKLRFF